MGLHTFQRRWKRIQARRRRRSGQDPANHNVTNCIAFSNAADGFLDNSQPGNFFLARNTAWNNAGVGFKFATAIATLKNNIAAGNKGGEASLSSSQTSSGNSWNIGEMWSNSSFKSVDSSTVTGAGGSSGKIVGSNFLLPISGKQLAPPLTGQIARGALSD